jgi:hypothetical protein
MTLRPPIPAINPIEVAPHVFWRVLREAARNKKRSIAQETQLSLSLDMADDFIEGCLDGN